MKDVIDLKGKKIKVPLETPVVTRNGVHFIPSNKDKIEIKERELEYKKEAKIIKNNNIIQKRRQLKGSAEFQLEYAIENGWDALILKNKQIDNNNPLEV